MTVFGGIPLIVSLPLPPLSELSKTVTRMFGDKANNITVTFCLQFKPLALYFASAETAFAGIPMNVKSLSTMPRHS